MEIIDAQIHDVKPVTPPSTDLSDDQSVELSAELAVTAMDAVGVSRAVVNSSLAIVSSYCARFPDRFAGLPFLSVDARVGELDEHFADLRDRPGVVGVRLLFATAAQLARISEVHALYPELAEMQPLSTEDLAAGHCAPFFEAAARQRLPLFVQAAGHLSMLRDPLEANPELTLIIDHLGLPTPPNVPAGPELFDGLPALLELARFPNVVVKFTGAPSLSLEPYPYSDLWPHLRPVIDAFGVDRLMWGSDFTRCRGLHTYRESVDFLMFTDEFTAAEKESLFFGTIGRVLDWPA